MHQYVWRTRRQVFLQDGKKWQFAWDVLTRPPATQLYACRTCLDSCHASASFHPRYPRATEKLSTKEPYIRKGQTQGYSIRLNTEPHVRACSAHIRPTACIPILIWWLYALELASRGAGPEDARSVWRHSCPFSCAGEGRRRYSRNLSTMSTCV
jgi:hypothetical protein